MKYYYVEWWLRPPVMHYFKYFYSHMPQLLVPTPFIRSKLENEGFDQITRMKIWGRGVDMQIFNPSRRSQEFRSRYGIGAEEVVLLWVGRLVQEKRPEIWVDVARRLTQEGVPFKGLVVGKGSFQTEMEALENVRVAGWLSGEELGVAYASADCLLFPSDVETFGNVTLEALASGVPCVVEQGCSGHLVENGKNGFTAPSGDVEKFYTATKRIIMDAQLRKSFRPKCVAKAKEYERSKILQRMLEHYKDCHQRHDPEGLRQEQARLPAYRCCYVVPLDAAVKLGKLLGCIFTFIITFFMSVVANCKACISRRARLARRSTLPIVSESRRKR
uniref:Glycosyl transferase family 1 domain-containing protein n=2 Tax=Fibrocapsa japonica TaxID=94617 RepID=A0A7S2UW85_9STRA|mmetsp:Transcript_13012/g.19203  ORF Transcript_13012/g.19203 Transcript_13012/m.19203 type:complete len:331 (+) Transcript_13012:532-1524(+)